MAIAIFSAAARNFTWIAVLLGLVGTLFMLYGSVLLIVESRMALSAIMTEMDFVWKVSQKYAGKELTAKPGGPFTWLGRKIQYGVTSRQAPLIGIDAHRPCNAGNSVAAMRRCRDTPATSANVIGSRGATLKSIDAMKRVSATAAARPIALATSVNSRP